MDPPAPWTTTSDGKRWRVEVKSKDFLDALDLFREVGEVAEKLDHHPDLHLEGYRNVRIETWSHDAGRVTERDARLAGRVTAILRARGLTT